MREVLFTTLTLDELKKSISDCIKLELSSQNKSELQIEEELIDIEKAAEILKVSKVTIHKWKKNNKIPYYKFGSRIRFKKKELLDAKFADSISKRINKRR